MVLLKTFLRLWKLKYLFNFYLTKNKEYLILLSNIYALSILKSNVFLLNSNYSLTSFYNYSLYVNNVFTNNYNKNQNLYYLKYFIEKFLCNLLNEKQLLIVFKNYNSYIIENNLYYLLNIKLRKFIYLNDIKISNKQFLNYLLIFFISKDVFLLKNILIKILENLHFKKHKRFLYNLKIIFKYLFITLGYKFNLQGVYLKIKGKIGVGGNSKKRKYILKIGKFSLTKKNQKMNYTKHVIRTVSGTLGFELYITYN